MPISTESGVWQESTYLDPIGERLQCFLASNRGSAYTIDELTAYLLEERPETLPESLRTTADVSAVTALVTAVVSEQFRREQVECRLLSPEDGEDPSFGTLYVTARGSDLELTGRAL